MEIELCTLRWLNRLSRVYLFGPLERENGGVSAGGPRRVPSFPSRKMEWFLNAGLVWAGRSGSWITKPGMEEQEGPVCCLSGPRAGLGEISWMGAYLPEVNSAVGFGSMLMRPRLYKGQLVSFCSLHYKPPPISGQTSCKCRKGGW